MAGLTGREPRPKSRRVLRNAATCLGLGIALGLGSCSGKDVLVGFNHSSAQAGGSGKSLPTAGTSGNGAFGGVSIPSTAIGSAAFGGTSVAGSSSSSSVDRCVNGGPDIQLPTIGGCTNDLARRIFLFAICTCSDFDTKGGVTTEPLGSPAEGLDVGASIGVNGSYRTEDNASYVKGSLWVFNDAEFGNHDIQGDLQCGQTLTVASASAVHRNAYISGDILAPGLVIDGNLSISDGTWGLVGSVAGNTRTLDNLRVPAPCACDNAIDTAAIVNHFRTDNDNALHHLSPSLLTTIKDAATLTLPCGRYYFDAVGGTAAVTLRITGKTLVAVGGDVTNSGGLAIELSDNATLDLFVAGDLQFTGSVTIGNVNRPAATRVYVAGRAALGNASLVPYANWYLPNSSLTLSTVSEFWGSLFTGGLRTSADLTVHYDQSVLDLPSCSQTSQACGSCFDCANPSPACHNGKCEACQVDADCCPPLYCNHGACQVEPVLF